MSKVRAMTIQTEQEREPQVFPTEQVQPVL